MKTRFRRLNGLFAAGSLLGIVALPFTGCTGITEDLDTTVEGPVSPAENSELTGEGAAALSEHWLSAPQLIPPFHIAADGFGDLGARFIDLDADGREDLVYHRWINATTQQAGAYLNTVAGWQWAPQFTPPFHIAADGFGDLGARFIDLDADGRMDMVYHRWINTTTQQAGAYLNTPGGWQWAPQFTPPFHIAADGHGDLGARFIDLDADGRMDMVHHRWINATTQQRGAYLNTPAGWQWAPQFIPPFHIAADGHRDLGARFIDLNADGRTDMVYHRWLSATTQQKGAYINTPAGWQWAPQFIPPFHIAADGFGDLGARFVELNADGRIDMVYHRWINATTQQKGAYVSTLGGWQWAPEYTPPFHIAADGFGDLGARFVELNADGRTDLVYHRWINGSTQQRGAFLNIP